MDQSTDQAASKTRIGRPPKHLFVDKRRTASIRLRETIRQKLLAASAASGEALCETGYRRVGRASPATWRTRTTRRRSDHRPLTATGETVSRAVAGDATHMPVLGLRDAARQAGVHRSSIHRAIRAGRLSATRTEGGDYAMTRPELFRVYPPWSERTRQGETLRAEQHATGPETAETDTTALRLRVATLEAEVRGLRDLTDILRRECDRWAAQAERLALAPPRRGWWLWRR